MLLHDLKKSKALKRKALRRWRWNASWRWNYCTKGCKGQKARSWFSLHPWFEWGQTPLFQRLPKNKWFKRYFKLRKDVAPISLSTLETDDRIKASSLLEKADLVTLWYAKSSQTIKILWSWDTTKSLSFWEWILFSSSAKSKVETSGWKVIA